MRFYRPFVAVSAVAALGWATLMAATPVMPVSEIRPGQVGIGRTVFDGTRVSSRT
jgi:hypothetical protein